MSSKPFDFNSVINPLARRPGLIELQGHRIPLPGVVSEEPLLRGCNQREWLERLVALGIRHLVVPLNSETEDTCLFARRHPRWDIATSGGELTSGAHRQVLFDLEHRDEGVFARLQFLLDASDALGVMMGFSLFGLDDPAGPAFSKVEGPLRGGGNIQGISLSPSDDIDYVERIESALENAAKWIAAELRGRTAVWVEVFRDREIPRSNLVKKLEKNLSKKIGEALGRPGDDAHRRLAGPWVLPAVNLDSQDAYGGRAAPFVAWRADSSSHSHAVKNPAPLSQIAQSRMGYPTPQRSGGAEQQIAEGMQSGELIRNELKPALFRDDPRRPAIREYDRQAHWPQSAPNASSKHEQESADSTIRASLWRSAMRGFWPLVPGGFEEAEGLRLWTPLKQLAVFAKQWVTYGYLRACPELLKLISRKWPELLADGTLSASTDGCGRYFVYCYNFPGDALDLDVFPGTYRYYWFNPETGAGIDRGVGLDGNHCSVPGPGDVREAVLVLEQEELPDPYSVW